MKEQRVIKVLIQTLDGRYVARFGGAWGLTSDFAKAEIFDYPDPGLGPDLKAGIVGAHGDFVVVPFDALKTHETCDLCGRKVRPSKTFFDGTRFFCPECRANAAAAGPAASVVKIQPLPGPQAG